MYLTISAQIVPRHLQCSIKAMPGSRKQACAIQMTAWRRWRRVSKDVLELRRIEVETVRAKQWIVSKCFAFFLLGIPLSA